MAKVRKEKPKGGATTIDIQPNMPEMISLYILGTEPLIMNAMSAKAKNELLAPHKKTTAERGLSLKHNPMREFRDSAYLFADDTHETRLSFPAPAFKQALMTAALDVEGATKAKLGRLVRVNNYAVELFGTPQLLMSVVKQAGLTKAPDIRTRAIVPSWCCLISLLYAKPQLNETVIAKLLASAGNFCGIGDWRQERGSGSYGCFELVNPNDARYQALLQQGREVQDAALREPEFFDEESQRLYDFFLNDTAARGRTALLDESSSLNGIPMNGDNADTEEQLSE